MNWATKAAAAADVMLERVVTAWLVSLAFTAPAFVLLELVVPRRRATIRWRAIALAAGLLAFNMVVVRTIQSAPYSSDAPRIAAAWIASEVFAYALHRAMHRVPLLWRFHRMHHTDVPLAWHQSWWIHPIDAALFACATTAACWLAGAPLVATAPILVTRKILGVLQHANIRWPSTPIDHVIVTPAIHCRHHREDLPPANFAGTFAILDRVFGTWAR